MMGMHINSSNEFNTKGKEINENKFTKVGDMEMNQLETVGNNKDGFEIQETHKNLITNKNDS